MSLFRASVAVLPRVQASLWHNYSCMAVLLRSGIYESEVESSVDHTFHTFKPPVYCAGACSPVRLFPFLNTFSRTERLEMLEEHLQFFLKKPTSHLSL